MKKRTKIFITVAVLVISALATAMGIYANDYYRAVNVDVYLKDGNGVTVSEIKEGCFFDGPGENKALIFYPGAKVDEAAYAPLMNSLALQGVDCFLIKMPMKMAFLRMNAADSILKKYSYNEYYLAGHSLGGAMAANYSAEHPSDFSALFLLASYPSEDLKAVRFPVIFIYGENDKVLNRDKLKTGFTLVNSDCEIVEIKGGNHANFASYGAQDGDGAATISAEEQQKITADTILNTINR